MKQTRTTPRGPLTRFALTVCAMLMMVTTAGGAEVDQATAAAWFEEAETLCERDDGRLWGVSLCGPMVFADAATGTIAVNRPVPDAPRPRVLGYANAALEWGGERWSTFVWPMIPEDDTERAEMMIHELFHRVQPELGLFVATSPGQSEHLESVDGRYWLQLEWRALARAIESSGESRLDAVRDALAFRLARHEAFTQAAEIERISEINEGLAQYTATAVAADSREDAIASALRQLERIAEKESFVRTSAYPSGAAYGLLLDEWSPGWTRRISATDDLGRMLSGAAGVKPANDIQEAARRYDGPELLAAEKERRAAHEARVAALRARFVDGPVLVIPRGKNASFITTGVTVIGEEGTIYPSFRVSGEWGSIEADMVLVSADGQFLTVPAPETNSGRVIEGDGWSLTLEPGWGVSAGTREGDLQVVRQRVMQQKE